MGVDKLNSGTEDLPMRRGGITEIGGPLSESVVLQAREEVGNELAEVLDADSASTELSGSVSTPAELPESVSASTQRPKLMEFSAEELDLLVFDLDIIYNSVEFPEIPMYLQVSFNWMDQIVRSLPGMSEERGLGTRIMNPLFKKNLERIKTDTLLKMKEVARQLVEAGFVRKTRSTRPPKPL
ncbi:hypothetical protein IT411_00250 [Candidatus Peregrinibacteria bacterium]|nr:hypothetical protein [Candidatus Peregrinibacteria bacterium]